MLEVRRIVNGIFTSNTYLLLDERYEYCWLVDIGDYDKAALAMTKDIVVKGVLLTHTHFDHTYGINALHRAWPKSKVYTSEYGKLALYDDKKNFSRYYEAAFTYEGNDVEVLKDGDKIELYPDVYMTAYETSGHCPSCLTYVVDNWIFTGDAFIPRVKVVTKLPQGNRILAQQSTEIIIALAKGKNVCPGHGEIDFQYEEDG